VSPAFSTKGFTSYSFHQTQGFVFVTLNRFTLGRFNKVWKSQIHKNIQYGLWLNTDESSSSNRRWR